MQGHPQDPRFRNQLGQPNGYPQQQQQPQMQMQHQQMQQPQMRPPHPVGPLPGNPYSQGPQSPRAQQGYPQQPQQPQQFGQPQGYPQQHQGSYPPPQPQSYPPQQPYPSPAPMMAPLPPQHAQQQQQPYGQPPQQQPQQPQNSFGLPNAGFGMPSFGGVGTNALVGGALNKMPKVSGLPAPLALGFPLVAVLVALVFDVIFLKIHIPGIGGYAWYLTTALSFAGAGYLGIKWTRAGSGLVSGGLVVAGIIYGVLDLGLGLVLEELSMGSAMFLGIQGLVIALVTGFGGMYKALRQRNAEADDD
jgi:hypothetical protein